jgi:hypothetical protein
MSNAARGLVSWRLLRFRKPSTIRACTLALSMVAVVLSLIAWDGPGGSASGRAPASASAAQLYNAVPQLASTAPQLGGGTDPAYQLALAQGFARANKNVDLGAALDLSPDCKGFLHPTDVILFCGSSHVSASAIVGPGQLQVSGPGLSGEPAGAFTQAPGPPLHSGDTLELHALKPASGQLVAVSVSRSNMLLYSRFSLDLPAGASARLRNDPGRGVMLESDHGTAKAPSRVVKVRYPAPQGR